MNSEVNFVQPFFGSVVESINHANLCVLGIPWDVSSTYRRGAVQGPTFIRTATSGMLYNGYTELGINVQEKWQIFDCGDVQVNNLSPLNARKNIFETINKFNRYGMRYLFLGGDHLSTYFTYWSLKQLEDKKIGLIYLDAHPDLYEEYEGNKYSHACVVKRIIDDCHIDPSHIVEVGIRAATPEQTSYAQNVGLKIITNQEFLSMGPLGVAEIIKNHLPSNLDNVYVSLDLDILDPAYAPGVGNPQPGGLSTQNLIQFIQGLQGLKVTMFDVVELCPQIDYSGITSFAAAMLIKEALGIMVK